MRKLSLPDGSTRQDLFLRFRLQFLRSDPRFTMLSDAAQALYVYLEAGALWERREILTPEASLVKIIAHDRHRSEDETKQALAELMSGPRPLIERLKDKRLRAVGLRKTHGLNFGWRQEAEMGAMYENDGTPEALKFHSSDTRVRRKSHSSHTRARDVDVDVEGDVDIDKDVDTSTANGAAHSPPTAGKAKTTGKMPGYATRALSIIQKRIQGWDCNGFKDMYRLLQLVGQRVKAGHASAVFTVGHAKDCESPGQFVRELAKGGGDPTKEAMDWARARMNATEGPKPMAAGKPVRLNPS